MTSSIETFAREFAAEAHAGQMRKYTGEPYIVHPRAVAMMVKDRGADSETIAAAFLHDVVEDTKVELAEVEQKFGGRVAMMVMHLTNVPLSEGNRAVRFKMNLNRLALASPEAKTIKLADLIDNTGSIVRHDPKFAKLYLEEKRITLDVLEGGDRVLWKRASDICNQGLEDLLRRAL